VANNDRKTLPSLKEVLEQINNAVDDFISRPANGANDRGAFGDYPLHKVAIWGDLDAAEVLLAHGADINALGEDDDTPLHRAVAGDKSEMVRFLLRHGADPKIKNRYGNTAWDEARNSKNLDLTKAFKARQL
jgi:ankyrin repeat protein